MSDDFKDKGYHSKSEMRRLEHVKPKVVEELEGLIAQAIAERSHFYVRSVCEKAVIAIGQLMADRDKALQALHGLERLSEAVEESYSDDVIVRCELTAGDIRAVMRVLYPNDRKWQDE